MDHYNSGNDLAALKQFIIELENDKDNIKLFNKINGYINRIFSQKKLIYTSEFVAWVTNQAKIGNSYAQCFLGRIYRQGIGVRPNVDLAFKWRKKSADQNNVAGQTDLAYMYRNGEGTSVDKKEACRLYLLAANKGCGVAQASLGVVYEMGWLGPQDLILSRKMYMLGAHNGSTQAKLYLAEVFSQGLGVSVDLVEGIKWYKLAAEEGSGEACTALGQIYRIGLCGGVDVMEAAKWFQQGALMGESRAKECLLKMYKSNEYGEMIRLCGLKEKSLDRHFIQFTTSELFCIVAKRGDTFLNDVYERWTKYEELEKRCKKLEEENDALKIEVDFRPGGKGYEVAKEHAESCFEMSLRSRG